MPEYAMYLRKSRADIEAEARGEGETLARHQTQLIELAKRQNLNVGAIYKELVSGETIAARPVMQQLLDEVSAGKWDGVLVMEIERLARGDTMDQGLVAQAFKFSETKIITPSKVYDPTNEFDEEYFEFSLFMSRREYKTIRRRMQAGRIASVREGNYIGSLPPYGYRKVRNYEEKCFTLEPIEQEADTVRLMFDLYINNDMGYNKIATYLNKLGISPKRTDAWSASSVKDIIQNPIYCGKLRWNWRKTQKKLADGKVVLSRPKAEGVVYQGKHPPIVSEEIWQAAQDIPSKAHHNAVNNLHGPVQNPFVGLLYCEKCGHAMTRRPYGDRPPYYLCVHKGCTCKSSSVTEIDELLLAELRKQYRKFMAMAKKGKSIPKQNMEIEKAAASELEKLKKQQSKLYDLLEQGVYTTEVFVERSAVINERIKEVREILAQQKPAKVEITPQEACIRLKNVIDNYDNLNDPVRKNNLLKEVIKRINYRKTTGGRYCVSDLELKIDYIF